MLHEVSNVIVHDLKYLKLIYHLSEIYRCDLEILSKILKLIQDFGSFQSLELIIHRNWGDQAHIGVMTRQIRLLLCLQLTRQSQLNSLIICVHVCAHTHVMDWYVQYNW